MILQNYDAMSGKLGKTDIWPSLSLPRIFLTERTINSFDATKQHRVARFRKSRLKLKLQRRQRKFVAVIIS